VCRIFQDGNTFIREIEKDDGSPYGTAFFQDGNIDDVADAYQHKDEHLQDMVGNDLQPDQTMEEFVLEVLADSLPYLRANHWPKYRLQD
jgi:hypothetical protein